MCGLPTRPTRTSCRSPSWPRRSSRPAARSAAAATSAAPSRSAGSCRTRRSSGVASSAPRRPTRLAKLRDALRSDRRYGSSIGFRYHDGKPGIVEGLLSRGDRRVGRVIEAVWRDGGRFDGWSEHFSYERWMRSAERRWPTCPWTSPGTPPASGARPRCSVGPHRLRPRQGVALGRLAGRARRDRGRRLPLDPMFRLRCLPQMGTEIETGPTGKTLTVLGPAASRCSSPRRPPTDPPLPPPPPALAVRGAERHTARRYPRGGEERACGPEPLGAVWGEVPWKGSRGIPGRRGGGGRVSDLTRMRLACPQTTGSPPPTTSLTACGAGGSSRRGSAGRGRPGGRRGGRRHGQRRGLHLYAAAGRTRTCTGRTSRTSGSTRPIGRRDGHVRLVGAAGRRVVRPRGQLDVAPARRDLRHSDPRALEDEAVRSRP